ncbi:hypothetical protein L218DRAFT_829186, partial [Marasmius fiardii PR-910]
QSWQAIQKMVDDNDEDLVSGYKEDIDTLLVFAGLFSAVVTAFVIESYQWLQEDPSETTVALLRELVQQGRGETPSTPELFVASPSVVRINTFWFLSLAVTLVDALFAILCKQWIRELRRQTNSTTPQEALALRWLRHKSFKEWKVPGMLASLPILLEAALFLFFAGFLELLWMTHPVPFGFALAVVGIAGIFYLLTTVLPGLSIIHHALQDHPSLNNLLAPRFHTTEFWTLPEASFVCPYKSPQSWLMFKFISSVCDWIPGLHCVVYLGIRTFNRNWKAEWTNIHIYQLTFSTSILNLSGWASLDLNVIQRFSTIKGRPNLYHWLGFRWLVQETRDNPSMIPHLKNVLGELPQHLAMCTDFEKWE